jgi:hypothetical protein
MKIKPGNISTVLVNSDNETSRDLGLVSLAMDAVYILVGLFLVYAAKTKDRHLSERILVASISALGGSGVGYGGRQGFKRLSVQKAS